MNIRAVYKTSLIDFPGKISTVLFTGGCNLQCKYCHNADLARNCSDLEEHSEEQVLTLLKARKGLIDAVTISGGEPTLRKNIDRFISAIKEIPLLVKLDSNGLQPETIERLVNKGLIDYVAIDIKTSPEKYNELSGQLVDFEKIKQTINFLKQSSIEYEVRTTCIPGYISMEDLRSIKASIGHVKNYYLQQYITNVELMDESFQEIVPYSSKQLKEFQSYVNSFADHSEIRGI